MLVAGSRESKAFCLSVTESFETVDSYFSTGRSIGMCCSSEGGTVGMPWKRASMILGEELAPRWGEKGCCSGGGGGKGLVGGVDVLEKKLSCRLARLSIVVDRIKAQVAVDTPLTRGTAELGPALKGFCNLYYTYKL